MKKHLLLAVLLILALSLSACNPNLAKENNVPDTSSSPETTEETVKPADVSTEEKNDLGSEVEFLWDGMEKEYTGDYSYLDLPFFRDYDIPTLRSACKVVKADSVEGMAGEWVYCEELNEDLAYYDLKEVTSGLEDKTMYLTEDGYLTKETILFKDSLFYQLLNESSEYTPIPGIYNYSTGIKGDDAFSEGEAKFEQGLVYFVNGNDVDRMSFAVVSLSDGHYILSIEYRVRESANTMATGEPKVKFSYYRSTAIVK